MAGAGGAAHSGEENDGHTSDREDTMSTIGFGQHLVMDHERDVQRAERRARLSLEEQGARGLLEEAGRASGIKPVCLEPAEPSRPLGDRRGRPGVAGLLAHLWARAHG
jgi:hypothetical protein